jgi:uncharacterized membrane protein YjfL (UPF0719 family)
MKRTYWYAAMTKDEAQHSRMTFYEAVIAVILWIGYYTIYKNITSHDENLRQ